MKPEPRDGERLCFWVLSALFFAGGLCLLNALLTGRWISFAVGVACWSMFGFIMQTADFGDDEDGDEA